MGYKIVTDGLVAKWSKDSWDSGTSWIDDIGGKVINFTGEPSKSADGIELPSSITFASESLESLGLSNKCTFEWLGRIDGAFADPNPGHVFGLSIKAGAWSGICCYSKPANNKYGVELDIGVKNTIRSGIAEEGIEYHIVLTVNGSTTTGYFNNITPSGTTAQSAGYASKYYLYNNEGAGRFNGAISRMCLWNKPLSDEEIATLFTTEDSFGVYTKLDNSWKEATKAFQKKDGIWQEIDSGTAKIILSNSNIVRR